TGTTVTRVDPTIDLSIATGGSPIAGIDPGTFSVRWTGSVLAKFSEVYTFTTVSDDGVRLFVNGQQIINDWTDHGPTTDVGNFALQAGQVYSIRLEYYQDGGSGDMHLSWSSP